MTNDERMTKSERTRHDLDDAFWNDPAELSIREEPSAARVYDLEERTARFGEAVIDFARTIPQDAVTNRITNQLVGAGTSVGANYVGADDAVSKPRMLSGLKSIGTCKKETREVKHFLRMAVRAVPDLKSRGRELWLEARELHLIFSKIWRSGKMNDEIPTTNNQGIRLVIRASSLVRHSSFVIRHSSF